MTVLESIFDNINTELAAIVAGGTSTGGHVFNFTPSVARVDDYQHINFDGAKNPDVPLYLIRDTGDEVEVEPERFGDLGRQITVPILVCKKDERDELDPFSTSVVSTTTRNKMIDDVLAKLAEDDNRGQTDEVVVNTEFPRIERGFYHMGWILAEMTVLITFRFPRAKP